MYKFKHVMSNATWLILLCSCSNFDTIRTSGSETLSAHLNSGPANCTRLAQAKQLTENQEISVIRLSDGDTFVGCTTDEEKLKVKVRVAGIDCPETHHNEKCERDGRQGRRNCEEQIPLGTKALQRALALIRNQVITLESSRQGGGFKRDDFDRVLAYIRLKDGSDFGKKLIEEGLCEDFSWKYKHPRQNDYKEAERMANTN